MSVPELVITEPTPDLIQYLEDRIYEFNSSATGITDGEWLAIVMRDEKDRIAAGICGNTWGGCLEIRQLWVDEARRKQRLRRRLLEATEQEARRRGCRQILLMTFTFQAPAFCAKHGFEVVAVVDNHPRRHKNLLLLKRLGEQLITPQAGPCWLALARRGRSPGASGGRTSQARRSTMSMRTASCHCGQLRIAVEGEPAAVGICHCLACQQRTGSVFAALASFLGQYIVYGQATEYVRAGEQGARFRFRFCPVCGTSLFHKEEGQAGRVGVAVGAFSDPTFPAPRFSIYDCRRHPWVQLPAGTTAYQRDPA
jgi:GNAT superfamily N-acetyltransferase